MTERQAWGKVGAVCRTYNLVCVLLGAICKLQMECMCPLEVREACWWLAGWVTDGKGHLSRLL